MSERMSVQSGTKTAIPMLSPARSVEELDKNVRNQISCFLNCRNGDRTNVDLIRTHLEAAVTDGKRMTSIEKGSSRETDLMLKSLRTTLRLGADKELSMTILKTDTHTVVQVLDAKTSQPILGLGYSRTPVTPENLNNEHKFIVTQALQSRNSGLVDPGANIGRMINFGGDPARKRR